MPYLM